MKYGLDSINGSDTKGLPKFVQDNYVPSSGALSYSRIRFGSERTDALISMRLKIIYLSALRIFKNNKIVRLGDLLWILTPNTGQLNPLFHTFAEFRLILNRIVPWQPTDWLAANAQFSPNDDFNMTLPFWDEMIHRLWTPQFGVTMNGHHVDNDFRSSWNMISTDICILRAHSGCHTEIVNVFHKCFRNNTNTLETIRLHRVFPKFLTENQDNNFFTNT